jgi:hypothetical protein
VLRGAGYFSHALWVAQRAQEAGWQLDLLLEDMQDYDAALGFIGELGHGWVVLTGLSGLQARG